MFKFGRYFDDTKFGEVSKGEGGTEMKKWLILFLATVLVIFMYASVASASGYLSDATIQSMTDPNDPHGGYSNSTNKCKACHATHLAEGSYRLLRTSDSSTECDYCHKDPTGIISTVTKINGATAEGHTMGYSGDAPDDTDTAWNTSGLKCADCHSVHDNNTVQLADMTSTHMLKDNPDGEGSAFTSSDYLTAWCADCHGANRGLHTVGKTVGGATRYGHDSSDEGTVLDGANVKVDPDDGVNNGPTCNECHSATAFPHDAAGSSKDLLKDGYGGTALDDVCNDCHVIASLP